MNTTNMLTCNRAKWNGIDANHHKKGPDLTKREQGFCRMQTSVHNPFVV